MNEADQIFILGNNATMWAKIELRNGAQQRNRAKLGLRVGLKQRLAFERGNFLWEDQRKNELRIFELRVRAVGSAVG